MTIRYDARQDSRGWTVFDRWTGHTVVLGGAAQAELPRTDAEALVQRLNAPRSDDDRSILQ